MELTNMLVIDGDNPFNSDELSQLCNVVGKFGFETFGYSGERIYFFTNSKVFEPYYDHLNDVSTKINNELNINLRNKIIKIGVLRLGAYTEFTSMVEKGN